MRGRQSPLRRRHTFMPFGTRIQVRGRVHSGLRAFFMLGLLLISVIESPEFPGMGMGRFYMGFRVIQVDMGVEKEEWRQGKQEIEEEQQG